MLREKEGDFWVQSYLGKELRDLSTEGFTLFIETVTSQTEPNAVYLKSELDPELSVS